MPRIRRTVNVGRRGVAPLPPMNLDDTIRVSPRPPVCDFCGQRHTPRDDTPDPDVVPDVVPDDEQDDESGWVPPIEQTLAENARMPTNARDLIEWINTPERARAALDVETARDRGPRVTVLAQIDEVLGGER